MGAAPALMQACIAPSCSYSFRGQVAPFRKGLGFWEVSEYQEEPDKRGGGGSDWSDPT